MGEGSIEVLFNPGAVALSRGVAWERQLAVSGQTSAEVQQEFRSVQAERLAIELFFDTYEPASSGTAGNAGLLPATGPARPAATDDVRRHTGRIALLAKVDRELHRPPVCRLRWGAFDMFTGVLTRLAQRFTLFLADGTPVRARVACEFVECGTEAGRRAGELHSADVPRTRRLRTTETLQSIAAEEYRDPGRWRHIARANGIVNPRDLRPGTVLVIPKLRLGEADDADR